MYRYEKTLFFISFFLALFVLTGCDSSSSSQRDDKTGDITLSGHVVNGPLAGATVIVYDNENFSIGTTETGEKGFFSIEGLPDSPPYLIVAVGGTVNGKPYTGKLTGRFETTPCDVTPLTTVIEELASNQEREFAEVKSKIMDWLGFDEDPFMADFEGTPIYAVDLEPIRAAITEHGLDDWVAQLISFFEDDVPAEDRGKDWFGEKPVDPGDPDPDPQKYNVKFNDYDGAVIDTQTVDHGGSATAPAEPTREGYTFTGWDNAFDNIAADLTVTAQYAINTPENLEAEAGDRQVTLTWDAMEGATGYYLYYSIHDDIHPSHGDSYDELIELGDVFQYMVEGLENGTTYYFLITALVKGDESSPSSVVSATPQVSGITKSLGMDFVYIEPGTFMMGSPEDELGREPYERDETQHQVTLNQGYYMQTTPVTQGQWKAVMDDNPSYFTNCGSDCPVENVSWHDIQDFIAELNDLEDKTGYALPTEAQWEYAARAGSTTAFANGEITEIGYGYDPVLGSMGWYTYNSQVDYSPNREGKGTHPVAQKAPNAWGLYDMHGNVWEWVADWYGTYPTSAVVDPTGPASGIERVGRGGSWRNYAISCRSAHRIGNNPDRRNNLRGFRLVLFPAPPVNITNSISMDFVYIEPGSFMMGSPEDEPGRSSDETQHQVTLTQDYYIQTTPVTQGQWEAVMGDNPSYFSDCGDECPVESVSWNDAQDFITTLNNLEGTTGYTLPTEAQWEYAARAGSTTAFANGQITETGSGYDPVLDSMGWYQYNSNADHSPRSDGIGTHLVAQKAPNAWGLYDMHGNVWEWVADWYGTYPTSAVTDPKGPSSGRGRVVRGGSWYEIPRYCRSARRGYNSQGGTRSITGFRLVLLPGH